MTLASLFSGCGGLDLGLMGGFDFLGKHYAKTGFEVVWANDISPAACACYRAKLGDYILEGDIRDHMDSLPCTVDLVVGGFPCRDISINGKMLGLAGEKSSLYRYLVAAVERCQPKRFIAENVGGLLSKKHEGALAQILRDFASLGYTLHYQLYHAEANGVPQTRYRVIIVGDKEGWPDFLPPAPLEEAPITAFEALHDLEKLPEDKAFAHTWSRAKKSARQGNRRLLANRPGYTLRAECHGNIQFHYALPRRMSMREAARIQSFPDSFSFPCGLRETERQIGNSVPPVLAGTWPMQRRLFSKGQHN